MQYIKVTAIQNTSSNTPTKVRVLVFIESIGMIDELKDNKNAKSRIIFKYHTMMAIDCVESIEQIEKLVEGDKT